MFAAERAFDALGSAGRTGTVEHGIAGAFVGNGCGGVFAHGGCVIFEAGDVAADGESIRTTRDQWDQGARLRQRPRRKNNATGRVLDNVGGLVRCEVPVNAGYIHARAHDPPGDGKEFEIVLHKNGYVIADAKPQLAQQLSNLIGLLIQLLPGQLLSAGGINDCRSLRF